MTVFRPLTALSRSDLESGKEVRVCTRSVQKQLIALDSIEQNPIRLNVAISLVSVLPLERMVFVSGGQFSLCS